MRLGISKKSFFQLLSLLALLAGGILLSPSQARAQEQVVDVQVQGNRAVQTEVIQLKRVSH